MKIVFVLAATAALIACAYLNLDIAWLIVIQAIAGSILLGLSVSSICKAADAGKRIKSLELENFCLSADAEENRKNKERARKILGH